MAYSIYFFECDILWRHGGRFILLEKSIDDAFNNDGSFRWLAGLDTVAERPPQRRLIARIRLIDLNFRNDRPDIARHFGSQKPRTP